MKDVREHADPHLTCILVGNKSDLCTDDSGASTKSGSSGGGTNPGQRPRQVPTDEAEIWAKEEGLLFVETSAKSGANVEIAFERATRDILDKIRKGVFDDDRVSLSFFDLCLNGGWCGIGMVSLVSFIPDRPLVFHFIRGHCYF